MNLSPQERERRSQVARRLHQEGRFGGSQRGHQGGIAKARKSSELAQELVEKHRSKIEKALLNGLNSPRTTEQLKSAELLLKYALASERMDLAEHRVESEQLSREEMLKVLAEKFTSGPTADLLHAQLAGEPVIEAEVVEVELGPE